MPAYVWTADPLALIPSLTLAYFEGLWSIIALDSGAYIIVLVVLLGHRFSFNIRAWAICLMLYGLGIGLMVILGPTGAGYIWLFGASVMMAAILGFNAAMWSLLLNCCTLVTVAFISPTEAQHGLCPWKMFSRSGAL